MSITERCLMMKKVIYAEEELQEVLVEYQDRWDYMEEVSELERKTCFAKRAESLPNRWWLAFNSCSP